MTLLRVGFRLAALSIPAVILRGGLPSGLLEIGEFVEVVHALHEDEGFQLRDSSGKGVEFGADLELDFAGSWIGHLAAGRVAAGGNESEVMRVNKREGLGHDFNAEDPVLYLDSGLIHGEHGFAGECPGGPDEEDTESDAEAGNNKPRERGLDFFGRGIRTHRNGIVVQRA